MNLAKALEAALVTGAQYVLVFGLFVAAELRFTTGDVNGGLALLGGVLADPSLTTQDHQEADRILERVRTADRLDDAEIATGLAAAQSADIHLLAKGALLDLDW